MIDEIAAMLHQPRALHERIGDLAKAIPVLVAVQVTAEHETVKQLRHDETSVLPWRKQSRTICAS
jgi:nucleoside-triphosphatase THEP1